PARELLRRVLRALAKERARPAEEHPARTHAEAGNRFPSTRLRDWVTARDRTCRAPGCSLDATRCDTDHTLAVTDHGHTLAENLGPLCRRDHRFKHDPDTGWTVQQTRRGRFEWISPTGRIHVREPERYQPLGDPIARAGPPPALDEYRPRRGRPGEPRPNKHGIATWASLDTSSYLRHRAATLTGQTDEPPF
ncbi:HNH endonuclease signature motif containing protein, partial [Actinomycetospora atypica]